MYLHIKTQSPALSQCTKMAVTQNSVAVNEPPNETGQDPATGQDQNQRNHSRTQEILRLIFVGLLLPAFDLGTDLMAIYQYWTSNQWVLNYLAVGLITSIIWHNLASAFYGWKNRKMLSSSDSSRGFTSSFPWNIGRGIFFCVGLGNVPITMELVWELFRRKHLSSK